VKTYKFAFVVGLRTYQHPCTQTGHCIDWLLNKANETWLNMKNFNKESDFTLSGAWYPVTIQQQDQTLQALDSSHQPTMARG
jgi:hypothetical protein